ncbi:hypothetical protein PR048_032240 [Dryococelus australis]|uniref:Uncharacterized protein n=1 Tax=Dryococelus australis TaxID=614101 RepID=A0ABQ9G4N6_9NEOP|nr:hypothetical protein PR048_032240 [Dryococelus australis]
MEQRLSEGAGEAGGTREDPPTSGIVRHDSHRRRSGSDPTGNRARFAMVGGDNSPVMFGHAFQKQKHAGEAGQKVGLCRSFALHGSAVAKLARLDPRQSVASVSCPVRPSHITKTDSRTDEPTPFWRRSLDLPASAKVAYASGFRWPVPWCLFIYLLFQSNTTSTFWLADIMNPANLLSPTGAFAYFRILGIEKYHRGEKVTIDTRKGVPVCVSKHFRYAFAAGRFQHHASSLGTLRNSRYFPAARYNSPSYTRPSRVHLSVGFCSSGDVYSLLTWLDVTGPASRWRGEQSDHSATAAPPVSRTSSSMFSARTSQQLPSREKWLFVAGTSHSIPEQGLNAWWADWRPRRVNDVSLPRSRAKWRLRAQPRRPVRPRSWSVMGRPPSICPVLPPLQAGHSRWKGGGARGGVVVRLLASHLGEPCSITGGVSPLFRIWESCWTITLIGEFSRGYPVSPALAFLRCYNGPMHPILTSQGFIAKSRAHGKLSRKHFSPFAPPSPFPIKPNDDATTDSFLNCVAVAGAVTAARSTAPPGSAYLLRDSRDSRHIHNSEDMPSAPRSPPPFTQRSLAIPSTLIDSRHDRADKKAVIGDKRKDLARALGVPKDHRDGGRQKKKIWRGNTVLKVLGCSTSTYAIRVKTRTGVTFCRTTVLVGGVFSGISRFSHLFHSGAAPQFFTCIDFQDFDAKSRPNLSTHFGYGACTLGHGSAGCSGRRLSAIGPHPFWAIFSRCWLVEERAPRPKRGWEYIGRVYSPVHGVSATLHSPCVLANPARFLVQCLKVRSDRLSD